LHKMDRTPSKNSVSVDLVVTALIVFYPAIRFDTGC